ncbi:MAG: hypothetical protein HY714_05710 [Candidatus Omnitrophica bacterium]|nr:hypothetical protein [Candidatus Omnitrophota bacterium]
MTELQRKNIFYPAAILLILWLLAELLVFSCHARRAPVPGVSSRDVTDYSPVETGAALHPYLGSILEPAAPLPKRAPGKVIIGILGGFAASAVCDHDLDAFTEELRKNPLYSGKKIVTVRLAAPLYKQPQQLLLANYLLMSGAEFDILVNIDGLNEVTLAPDELLPLGVDPAFPAGWYSRMKILTSPELILSAAKLVRIKQCRAAAARIFGGVPFRYSPVCRLLWERFDRRLKNAASDLNESILAYVPENPDFVSKGSLKPYATEYELYEDLASAWMRSSWFLSNLCTLNGIRYVHILEPNPYLPPAGIALTAAQKIAYDSDRPYKRSAEMAYPILSQSGKKLAARGVRFHDLSTSLSGGQEEIYRALARKAGQLIK